MKLFSFFVLDLPFFCLYLRYIYSNPLQSYNKKAENTKHLRKSLTILTKQSMKSSQILKNVSNYLNVPIARIETECGFVHSRLQAVVAGRVKCISPAVADGICKRYPGISYSYLLTGTGSISADGVPYGENEVMITHRLTDAQRLTCILNHYHINQEKLTKLTGVPKAAVSQIRNGKRRISPQVAQLVCGHFRELSLDWLLYGVGGMMQDDSTPADAFTLGDSAPDSMKVVSAQEARMQRTIDRQNERIASMEDRLNRLCAIMLTKEHGSLKYSSELDDIARKVAEGSPDDEVQA